MANKRILYVEDDPINMWLVQKILLHAGYEVIEATDGLQGVAVAARTRPDLILMDINLPGINGMEATSRLKSAPDLGHIPIIAVTGATFPGGRKQIIAAGCDDYLPKPFSRKDLLLMVAKHISTPEGTVLE